MDPPGGGPALPGGFPPPSYAPGGKRKLGGGANRFSPMGLKRRGGDNQPMGLEGMPPIPGLSSGGPPAPLFQRPPPPNYSLSPFDPTQSGDGPSPLMGSPQSLPKTFGSGPVGPTRSGSNLFSTSGGPKPPNPGPFSAPPPEVNPFLATSSVGAPAPLFQRPPPPNYSLSPFDSTQTGDSPSSLMGGPPKSGPKSSGPISDLPAWARQPFGQPQAPIPSASGGAHSGSNLFSTPRESQPPPLGAFSAPPSEGNPFMAPSEREPALLFTQPPPKATPNPFDTPPPSKLFESGPPSNLFGPSETKKPATNLFHKMEPTLSQPNPFAVTEPTLFPSPGTQPLFASQPVLPEPTVSKPKKKPEPLFPPTVSESSNPFAKPQGGGINRFSMASEGSSMTSRLFSRPADKTKEPPAIVKEHPEPPPKEPMMAAATESKAFKPENERELVEIVKSQSFNDSDRFNILDARDKLMRIRGQDRQGTILTGTCPDMCPEKERYSRLAKNQLRTYEKLSGAINHKATVKEYSRSSADQEIPLPHDLRPSPVLDQTLNHIMCNIIDRIGNRCGTVLEWYDHITTGQEIEQEWVENPGEWFEYIWSTTRGIRKDITQQMLHDRLAVSLVEKCTRLHIICAERLIEENSHNFDRKLNDENLTKCLQTLSHMYEDCHLEGVELTSEPEFRAYEVLMNLNDGDTLRHIQNLDPWIRKSEQVRFAVKIFMALGSNNYIKFFKLVRKATLLQGCILLRYFYQVRFRALNTILRAYCPNKKVAVNFSLTNLTYVLGFEDIQECKSFCQWHGLTSEVNEDKIALDRQRFINPEEVPVVKRARNIIESKKLVSWSEVMNSGPLPENPYLRYNPHDSFDGQGYLKKDAWQALDQTRNQAPLSPEDVKRRYFEQSVQAVSKAVQEEIISQVLEEETVKVANGCERYMEQLKISAEIGREEFDTSVQVEVALVVGQALRELRNEEIQKRLAREVRQSENVEVAEDAFESIVDEISLEVGQEEMEIAEKEKKIAKSLETGKDIIDHLCADVIKTEASRIAQEALAQAETDRDLAINRIRLRRQRKIQTDIFNNWRLWARKQVQRAKVLSNFPSRPSDLSLSEQLKRLGPKNGTQSVLESLERHTLTSNLLAAQDIEDKILRELILQPIDFPSLLGKNLSKVQKKLSLVWKCILCRPIIGEESEDNHLFVQMMKRKLTREHRKDRSFTIPFGFQTISICIREVDTEVLEEDITLSEQKRREYLNGTLGILFIDLQAEESMEASRNRLKQLIEQLPQIPKIPVSVITDRPHKDKYSYDIGLVEIKSDGKISAFHVIHTPANVYELASIQSLDSSIAHLSEFLPELNLQDMTFQGLKDLAEDFVCSNVIVPMYENYMDRKRKDLPHQNPNLLIEFFNSSLDYLVQVSSQLELAEISWPAPEVQNEIPSYWNDSIYIDAIGQNIKAMKLPTMDNLEEPLTWGEQCHMIFAYFKGLNVDSQCLSQVRRRLLKCFRQFNCQDELAEFPSDFLPWTDLIKIAIDTRMSALDTHDPYDQETEASAIVGVFKEELKAFRPPAAWMRSRGYIPESRSQTIQDQFNQTLSKSFSSRAQTFSDEKLRGDLQNEVDSSQLFESKLKAALDPGRSLVLANRSLPILEPNGPAPESRGARYEPVIAYFSPSLAQRATGKHRWRRVENRENCEIIPDITTPEPKKRKNLFKEEFQVGSEQTSASKRVNRKEIRDLQGKIEEDLNASYDFEQRLQSALYHQS